MDCSKEVYLNVPYCPVNYKLCLDDLDLALLPMSWLLDSRESLRPKSDVLVNQQIDTEINKELDTQMEEKFNKEPFVMLAKLDSSTNPVEFEATAERKEQFCLKDTEFDEAKEGRHGLFCHICNINIPNKYTKEHNRSNLHVTLLRLANEAVSRLNKHIQQQLSEDPNTCYCAPCNEEVESLDDHERQIQHKLLKKREDLLANLLDLYIEEHGAFNDRTRQILNNLKSNAPLGSSDVALSHADENNINGTNSIVAARAITNNMCLVSQEHQRVAKEGFAILNGTMGNDSVVIPYETKEPPGKSKTTSLATRGYDRVPQQEKLILDASKAIPSKDTDSFFCKICAVYVPNKASNWHNNCPAHKEKLKQCNGTAEIETHSRNADSTGSYICIICAIKIPNTTSDITAHNNGAAHRAKLEQKDKSTSAKDAASTGYYYCHICAVKVPNHAPNISEHNQGAAHINKLEGMKSGRHGTSVSTTNGTQGLSLAPHKPNNQWLAGSSIVPHFVQAAKEAVSTGQYFCSICAVKVPNNTNNITSHNGGAAHRAKLAQLEASGKVTNMQKVSAVPTAAQPKPAGSVALKQPMDYFCDICSVNVPITNIIAHVNGLAHNANLQKRQVLEKSESTKTVPKNDYLTKGLSRVNYYCTVCGVNAGVGNFEQHFISKSHKDRVRNGNLRLNRTRGLFILSP